MKHIITLEEFLRRLKEKWGDAIEYVSGYKGLSFKCMFRCKKDRHTWFARPQDILRGAGCPKCSRERGNIKKRTSLEKLIADVDLISEHTIEYICGYVNSRTKCWWKCKICGWMWKATPMCIKQGHRCPECKRKNMTTPIEEMLEKLKNVWGNIIQYVSDYKKMTSKCKFKCTVCGNEWEATPTSIINGNGCPKCAIAKRTTPLEIMLKNVQKIHGDSIIYISGYINLQTKCKWKCKHCGYIWETTPASILQGTRCPKCSLISMEKPVMDFLDKLGIIYKHNTWLKGSNYKSSNRPLKTDFIIETSEYKLCIETDGKQHFYPIYSEERLKEQKERDRHKDKILKEQGFILIRVTSSPTKEWGTEKHITLDELFELFNIAYNSYTKQINFEIFKLYDFNR